MIVDLPIVEIRVPGMGSSLYLSSLNLLIAKHSKKYKVWDIKQNKLHLNEKLTQLLFQQQKLMYLPNQNQLLGQDYCTFWVFDFKEARIQCTYTNYNMFKIYFVDTDISSQRLLMNSFSKDTTFIYNLKNWKQQMLFLKTSTQCQFGRYTFCMSSPHIQHIYRSKINKKIRSMRLICQDLKYADGLLVYQNYKLKRDAVYIKYYQTRNDLCIIEKQISQFLIIEDFVLILSSEQLQIIDVKENQIIKQISYNYQKGDYNLGMFLKYQKNCCIYIFIACDKI